MKVLILSANTGGGHNSTAQSIGEQLSLLNIEYEIADTLAFISEKVSDFISWGHSYVYRKLPRLFGFGYRYEEKHPARFIYEQCARGVDALYEKVTAEGFDTVVCVHVFSGVMVTEMRRRYPLQIASYFVATDYTCSPGVSEMDLDGYFIPHRMLLGEFIRSGITADKLHATGIPIANAFYDEDDKALMRSALKLPEEGKVILLSCGSMGCGQLEKNARLLYSQLPEDTTLIVLCGKNEKLYETLIPYATDRLRILRFTENIAMYMSAADIYITKPGGLTTSEAIAKRLPMIFVDAVPGLETRNFDFLIQNGVACGTKSWRQVFGLLEKMLTHPEELEKQVEAMEQFTAQNAAEQICRHITKK